MSGSDALLREACLAAGHRAACGFCGGAFPDGHTANWPVPVCTCTAGTGKTPCPIGPALRAALDATPEPLDVERLARALCGHDKRWTFETCGNRDAHRLEARRIAAVYGSALGRGTMNGSDALLDALERVAPFDEQDRITAMNGTVREPRTPADFVDAYRTRLFAALRAALDATNEPEPRRNYGLGTDTNVDFIESADTRQRTLETLARVEAAYDLHQSGYLTPDSVSLAFVDAISGLREVIGGSASVDREDPA